jgi:predicted dehydrogenase
MPNSGRYSDDNVAATLEFAGGSIATITYTASGDKSFSKERLEVFVQGSVAVLDDFRELRTVRDGKRQVFKSRWRVDKGHRGEWVAFAESIRKGGPAPIAMDEIVNSTLATIALARAASSGGKIAVNSDQFVARFSGARTVAAIEGAR